MNLPGSRFELVAGANTISVPFAIGNPKLWWSNGLGEPNLYQFNIQFIIDDNIIAKDEVTTGLRSLKLIREKDASGESFAFELNGVSGFLPKEPIIFPTITF